MRLEARFAVATACVAAAALVSSSALADQSVAPELPTPVQLTALTPAEVTLLESGAPVDVLLDPSTGDILSVTAANPVPAPAISTRSVCDSGDGCYMTNKTPYADEGFYGASGTYDGSWPARSGYSAGRYAVSACWTTSCGPELAAGSKLTFTSDVTGTSFTIH